MGYDLPDLPVTEELNARLLRLPCFFGLLLESSERSLRELTGRELIDILTWIEAHEFDTGERSVLASFK